MHKDGERLYDLARAGIEVEREARPVTVYGLKVVPPTPPFHRSKEYNECEFTKSRFHSENNVEIDPNEDKSTLPYFGLEIESSGGFYVRTLIDDIGTSLNTVAHMTQLLRTKQGPFTLKDCLPPEKWNYEDIKKHIQYSSEKIAELENSLDIKL